MINANIQPTEQQLRDDYLIKNGWQIVLSVSDELAYDVWFKDDFIGTAQQCAHVQVMASCGLPYGI